MGGRGQPVVSTIIRGRDEGSIGFQKKFGGSDFSRRTALDQETQASTGRFALDYPVAFVRAKGRNVDRRQRIGGFEP